MILLVSPFLCRWREASGADAVCGSCGSASSGISTGAVGSGGVSNTWPTGSGSSPVSHSARKIRDASKKDGMSITTIYQS